MPIIKSDFRSKVLNSFKLIDIKRMKCHTSKVIGLEQQKLKLLCLDRVNVRYVKEI